MLELLLQWGEHWEAQHVPGWLYPLGMAMFPGQHLILEMGQGFWWQQPLITLAGLDAAWVVSVTGEGIGDLFGPCCESRS